MKNGIPKQQVAQVEIVYYPKKARGPVPRRLQTVETQIEVHVDSPQAGGSGGSGGSREAEDEALDRPPSRKGRRTLTDEIIDPSEQAFVDLTRLGHEAFEAGRADEARVIFESLVALGRRDPFAHTMLGTILLGAQSLDLALDQFEAALAIDPDELAALVYRGEIRLSRRKITRAVEDLERAVKLGPSADPFVARARKLLTLARANRTA